MSDLLVGAGVLVVWVLLQYIVLPRLGVLT